MEAMKELELTYRPAYSNGEPCGYVVQSGTANPLFDVQDESLAAMFAAAPDLLEACRAVQRYFDDMGPVLGESESAHNERMLRFLIQDAIAKASHS